MIRAIDDTELVHVAHLDFEFLARPDWSQTVHLFLVYEWIGEPVESEIVGKAVNGLWVDQLVEDCHV